MNGKHLAVFYTNNLISKFVLEASLCYFQRMITTFKLPMETRGVVISCNPIKLPDTEKQTNKIVNIIAPKSIQDKGHLSIIEKLSLALSVFPSDYVSLHEHDVLYPTNYLALTQRYISEIDPNFDYMAYSRIIGVNESGYVKRTLDDIPLSSLTFKFSVLELLLENKRREIKKNKGWCFLEPGYAGSYGKQMRKIVLNDADALPIVHVNMNDTSLNHHFTAHYLTYQTKSVVGFNQWPGDLSHLFVKTKLNPSISRTGLLNLFIQKHTYSSYLEIGVYNPQTNFDQVKCDRKVGVDPVPLRSDIIKATSDQFFNNIDKKEKFDLIFIDGLHYHEQVIKDICNSLCHLNKNGMIVCHDILPENELMQRVPQQTTMWTGDCWKAWTHFRMTYDNLKMFVVDTDYGLGVIQRGHQELFLPRRNIKDIDFSFFCENRQKLMNIIEEKEFRQIFRPV